MKYLIIIFLLFGCKLGDTFKKFEIDPKTNPSIKNGTSRDCVNRPDFTTGGKEFYNSSTKKYGECTNFTCVEDYTMVNGVCVQSYDTRACTSQPANSTGGFEETLDGSVSWSECKSFTCNAGFILSNNSCVSNANSENDYRFDTYLNNFLIVSAEMGHNSLYEPIIISEDNSMSPSTIAVCTYSVPRRIRINSLYWNNQMRTNKFRELVSFHEFGHCLLDRSHRDGYFVEPNTNQTIAVSMMSTFAISESTYYLFREYYLEELFQYASSLTNGEMALSNDHVECH